MNSDTRISPPAEILIIGAGVFGLSTALALLDRPHYDRSRITILDSAETLPNPVGSSVDASRIIRADYAQLTYAKLACLAQEHWRNREPGGWGGQGRYHETGFVLTGDAGQEAYVRSSMHNVQHLAKAGLPMQLDKIQELKDKAEIKQVTGLPGVSGDTGYANWNSGWADAEACVAFALEKITSHPNSRERISIKPGTKVSRLLFAGTGQCQGVETTTNQTIAADLTVLASGAWTPSLMNLQNRCLATGQVLAYLRLTQEEQAYLEKRPVIINFARGTFIIPPQKQEFKIARHGFGYRNPEHVSENPTSTVSVPRTDTDIPKEAEAALRDALAELFPPDADPSSIPPGCPPSLLDLSTRSFTQTRLCWYTDTPSGNFLIDYPPVVHSSSSPSPNNSLFVATGGSGHGFKFFPVLGSYIVDAIERKLEPEYAEMWRWPTDREIKENHGFGGADAEEFLECRDGSRGGPTGMVLSEELKKGVVTSGVS